MMHKLLQIITPKAFLRYISLFYKYFKIHGWRFLLYVFIIHTWWNIMKANVRWINWLSCLRVAIRCNIWENALFGVVNHPRCDVVTWQINVLCMPFLNESMYLIKTNYRLKWEWWMKAVCETYCLVGIISKKMALWKNGYADSLIF